jgi:hypothetical protein
VAKTVEETVGPFERVSLEMEQLPSAVASPSGAAVAAMANLTNAALSRGEFPSPAVAHLLPRTDVGNQPYLMGRTRSLMLAL